VTMKVAAFGVVDILRIATDNLAEMLNRDENRPTDGIELEQLGAMVSAEILAAMSEYIGTKQETAAVAQLQAILSSGMSRGLTLYAERFAAKVARPEWDCHGGRLN